MLAPIPSSKPSNQPTILTCLTLIFAFFCLFVPTFAALPIGQFNIDPAVATASHEFYIDPSYQIHPLPINEKIRFYIRPLANGPDTQSLYLQPNFMTQSVASNGHSLGSLNVLLTDLNTDTSTNVVSGNLIVTPTSNLPNQTTFAPSITYMTSTSRTDSQIGPISLNIQFKLEVVPSGATPCIIKLVNNEYSYCQCPDKTKWGKYCHLTAPTITSTDSVVMSPSNFGAANAFSAIFALPLDSVNRVGGFRIAQNGAGGQNSATRNTATTPTSIVVQTDFNEYKINTNSIQVKTTSQLVYRDTNSPVTTSHVTYDFELWDDHSNIYHLSNPFSITYSSGSDPTPASTTKSFSVFACPLKGIFGSTCTVGFQILQGLRTTDPTVLKYNTPIVYSLIAADSELVGMSATPISLGCLDLDNNVPVNVAISQHMFQRSNRYISGSFTVAVPTDVAFSTTNIQCEVQVLLGTTTFLTGYSYTLAKSDPLVSLYTKNLFPVIQSGSAQPVPSAQQAPLLSHAVVYPGFLLRFNVIHDFVSTEWTVVNLSTNQTFQIPNNVITNAIPEGIYNIIHGTTRTYYFIYVKNCPTGFYGPNCDATSTFTSPTNSIQHFFQTLQPDGSIVNPTMSASWSNTHPYSLPTKIPAIFLNHGSTPQDLRIPGVNNVFTLSTIPLDGRLLFTPIRLVFAVSEMYDPVGGIGGDVQFFYSSQCAACTTDDDDCAAKCTCIDGGKYGVKCDQTIPTTFTFSGQDLYTLAPSDSFTLTLSSALSTEITGVRLLLTRANGVEEAGIENDSFTDHTTATWIYSQFQTIPAGETYTYSIEFVSKQTIAHNVKIVYGDISAPILTLRRPTMKKYPDGATHGVNMWYCDAANAIGPQCDYTFSYISSSTDHTVVSAPSTLPFGSPFTVKIPEAGNSGLNFSFMVLNIADRTDQIGCSSDTTPETFTLSCGVTKPGTYQLYAQFTPNPATLVSFSMETQISFFNPTKTADQTVASFVMSLNDPLLTISAITCPLCSRLFPHDPTNGDIYFSVTAGSADILLPIVIPVTVTYNDASVLVDVYQFPITNLNHITVDFTKTLSGFDPSTTLYFRITPISTQFQDETDKPDPTLLTSQPFAGSIVEHDSDARLLCSIKSGTIAPISGLCVCRKGQFGGKSCELDITEFCTLQCPMYQQPDAACTQCMCKTDQCRRYSRTKLVSLTATPDWANLVDLHGPLGALQQLATELEIFIGLNKNPQTRAFPIDINQIGAFFTTTPPRPIGIEYITILPTNQAKFWKWANTLEILNIPKYTLSVLITVTVQPYNIPTGAQITTLDQRFDYFSQVLSTLFNPNTTTRDALVNSVLFGTPSKSSIYITALAPAFQTDLAKLPKQVPLLSTRCSTYSSPQSTTPSYNCPNPSFGTSPLWNCPLANPSIIIPTGSQASLIPSCSFLSNPLSPPTTQVLVTECPLYPDPTKLTCAELVSPPIPTSLPSTAQIALYQIPEPLYIGEPFAVKWETYDIPAAQAQFYTLALYLVQQDQFDRLLLAAPLSRNHAFITLPQSLNITTDTGVIIRVVLVQNVYYRNQTTPVMLKPSRLCSNPELAMCTTTDRVQLARGYGCNPATTQCGCTDPYIVDQNPANPTYLQCISPCQNGSKLVNNKCDCKGIPYSGEFCELLDTCNFLITNVPGVTTPTSVYCNKQGFDQSPRFGCGTETCACFNNFSQATMCKSCALTDKSNADLQCDSIGTDVDATNKACDKCVCKPGFSGHKCHSRALLVTLEFLSLPNVELISQSRLNQVAGDVTSIILLDLALSMSLPPDLFTVQFTLQTYTKTSTKTTIVFAIRSSTPSGAKNRFFSVTQVNPSDDNLDPYYSPTSSPFTSLQNDPNDTPHDSLPPTIEDLYDLWDILQDNQDKLPISNTQGQNSTGTTQPIGDSHDPNCDTSTPGNDCPTGSDPYGLFDNGAPIPGDLTPSSPTLSPGIIAVIVVCIAVAGVGSVSIVLCLKKNEKACFKPGEKKKSRGERANGSSTSTEFATVTSTDETGISATATLLTITPTQGSNQTLQSGSSTMSPTADFIDVALDPHEPELPPGWSKFRHRVTGQVAYINAELMRSEATNPNANRDDDVPGENDLLRNSKRW